MKIIIENKELLNEFTSKDRDEILKEGDKFTISYEIELESNTPLGDDPQASAQERERYARNYLDRDYFYNSVYEHDSEDFWLSQDVDDTDGEEIIEWQIKKDDLNVDEEKYKYFLYTDIASRNPEINEQIQKIITGCMTPGSALNQKMHQFLMERCDVAQKVFDSMSAADKEKLVQGELPLEDDAAKEQIIYRGLAAMDQDNLFKNYIINIDYEKKMVYAPLACDLKEFFLFLGLDDFAEEIEESAKTAIEALARPDRYSMVGSLTNLTNRSNEKMYAGSWHLKDLANRIETEAQDYIDAKADEEYDWYQDDPEDYLDMMGFEWDADIPVAGEAEDPEGVLREFLPNFMEKYGDVIKIEEDQSLNNGLEFSMDEPAYLSGIDEAFEFLEIFYKDYNAQSNLFMHTTTGLHTNIGIADSEEKDGLDYNLIKAVLFTNQKFATAGMGMASREYSRWSGDLRKYAKGGLEKLVWSSMDKEFPELSGNLVTNLEKELSDSVLSTARQHPKGIGFNVNHVRGMNYVEFRYPGGKVKEEDIKKATLYYAHLLKLAAYPEYKRKEYVTKLIGFVNDVATRQDEEIKSYEQIKTLRKGALLSYYSQQHGTDATMLHNYLLLGTKQQVSDVSTRWSSTIWGVYDGWDKDKKKFIVTWLRTKQGKIKAIQQDLSPFMLESSLRRNTFIPVASRPEDYVESHKVIAKIIDYARENEFDAEKVREFYVNSKELERERNKIVKAKARIELYKKRQAGKHPYNVAEPDRTEIALAKKFDDMPEHEFDKEQQAHRDNFMKSSSDNKELKENKKSLKILIENKVNENKIYRRGSKDAGPGGPVAIIQKLLMSKGYDLPNHKADGKYGPETAAAVKKFQKDAKIKEDGIVGPDTLEKMGINPKALEKRAAAVSKAAVSTGVTKKDKDRKTCDQGFVYDKNQRKCVPFKLDPNAPPANIPDDLWAEAIGSLGKHGSQIGDLENIAIIDYRRPNSQERMWIVQVATGQVVLHTKVGHGANSGSKYGAPTNFSNTKDSHMTSLGAYVTGGTYASSAGHLGCKDRNVPAKKCDARRKVRGVARRVQGLDSTNSQAASRHIIIHGASYSTDNTGGRSWGCFVTTPETNKKVVALLDKGSFLYAGPVSLQA